MNFLAFLWGLLQVLVKLFKMVSPIILTVLAPVELVHFVVVLQDLMLLQEKRLADLVPIVTVLFKITQSVLLETFANPPHSSAARPKMILLRKRILVAHHQIATLV